ncbi:hypothetical protein P879_04935 [Paragonimus westermani]|uniref:Uncharacterized protein n=1 Tax=Paragonimus westermani TaxID=34504 RepID=A0A8T0DPG4_9TREM|nr:hypothetical protein P879_04935 [Paragonimus westermani]
MILLIATAALYLLLWFACSQRRRIFMFVLFGLLCAAFLSFAIATGISYGDSRPFHGAWLLSAFLIPSVKQTYEKKGISPAESYSVFNGSHNNTVVYLEERSHSRKHWLNRKRWTHSSEIDPPHSTTIQFTQLF